jgi:hypothetical protein
MESATEADRDRPELASVKPDVKVALVGSELDLVERCFCEDNNVDKNIQVVQVIPDLGAYYLDGVITAAECRLLIDFVDSSNALSFWSEKGRQDASARAFRDADTIEFQSALVAQRLWTRIRNRLCDMHLDIEFTEADDESDSRWQVDLIGKWNPVGMNSDMLLARYPSLGSFAPHTDGTAIAEFNLRSFYSVVVG